MLPLSSIMIIEAYCAGNAHNMQLGSIMIMGAYCVGKVRNMLPWLYYDNGSILCRYGIQNATALVV